MKSDSEGKSIKIGFLVALGLIVLGLAIVGISSKQRLFEKKVTFYSVFPDTTGLKEGSNVSFQGVDVGFVTNIEFMDRGGKPEVKVTYKISSKILPMINSNIRAEIKSLGLLGDRFISLEKSEKETKPEINLLPNSEIQSYQPISLKQLGESAQDIMQSINELSKNINDLVIHISKEGPLAKIMNNPQLSDEFVEHYRRSAESLDVITTRLKNGEGIIGGLLAKEGEGDQTAKMLRESIINLNETLKGINEGKGVLGLLVSEMGDGKDARESLKDFFNALEKMSMAMEDSNSLAYKIFADEKFGKEFSENLLSISKSLESILKKIDIGEGSAGAFINDKELYDSLKLTADGIQRSKIVKWYLEKKAKERATEEKKKEENK